MPPRVAVLYVAAVSVEIEEHGSWDRRVRRRVNLRLSRVAIYRHAVDVRTGSRAWRTRREQHDDEKGAAAEQRRIHHEWLLNRPLEPVRDAHLAPGEDGAVIRVSGAACDRGGMNNPNVAGMRRDRISSEAPPLTGEHVAPRRWMAVSARSARASRLDRGNVTHTATDPWVKPAGATCDHHHGPAILDNFARHIVTARVAATQSNDEEQPADRSGTADAGLIRKRSAW